MPHQRAHADKRTIIPGIAAGMVRRSVRIVTKATSCGVDALPDSAPGVTMFGFSNEPSNNTPE